MIIVKILVMFQKGSVSDAKEYISAATAALTGNYPGYSVVVEATDGASEVVTEPPGTEPHGVDPEDVLNFLACLNY